MTTITDTFNRADSATTLGTTSDGTATWVTLAGTWGVSTNQAYCPTPAGQNIAYIASGSADGTLQVTNSVVAASGLAFRVQDINNFLLFYNSGGLFIYKFVGGSPTQLANCGAGANGDVLSVVLSGSSITAKKNGTTVGTATESAFQSVQNHGLVLATTSTAARWDDWSFTYTPVTPGPWRRPPITAVRGAVRRAAVI